MKILSIDTSSNLCAVAVLENTNLIKENILNWKYFLKLKNFTNL